MQIIKLKNNRQRFKQKGRDMNMTDSFSRLKEVISHSSNIIF